MILHDILMESSCGNENNVTVTTYRCYQQQQLVICLYRIYKY